MSDYLPKLVSTAEACAWLNKQTGETWTLQRLAENQILPFIWIDPPEDRPDIARLVFGDMWEGFLAQMCFYDVARLAAGVDDVLLTMTQLPDGRLCKFSNLRFDLADLRFKREDVQQLLDGRLQGGGIATSPEARDQRQRQQEALILAALRDKGYDPKQLPPWEAGKPGVKAEIRRALPNLTPKVFDKAWERLREFKEIGETR